MDVNGCGWVCMGALGCRAHGETCKQDKKSQKWSCRVYFRPYGRGNFPGHHVLAIKAKGSKDTSGWVQMGSSGCIGSHKHRRTAKHGKKNPNSACSGYISHVCQGRNKRASCQGWSRWSERVMGGKSWQGKGVAWRLYMYTKMQLHKCNKKHQKKRKQASLNCRKSLFFNHKHTACETSKKSRQNLAPRHHK